MSHTPFFAPIHAVVLTSVFLALGCQGEMNQTPGNVQLSLGLHESHIEIVDALEVGEVPNPPASADVVRFRFVPGDGSDAVEGLVDDPRLVRSEFDRAGQPDPQMLVSKAGIVDVRVPAKAGLLELSTQDGAMLGTVAFDPEAPRTQKQNLLREGDVLGRAVKVLDHGDSAHKADILFLPEGYAQDELPQFHAHVQEIITQMSSHSGYKDHWDGFNFWRQDVRSRSKGTGTLGSPIDTAFETASGVSGLERCVYFTNTAGMNAARRLGQEAGADVTVVLVNTTSYGGCATDGLVVSARPRWVADIVSHELGHALFGLADEYDSHRPGGRCSAGPNVAISHRHEALPWADMVNTSELPTSPSARFGTIGAFEGAGYCAQGRFRPTHNCMMRTLGTGMCSVCQREMARTMEALAPSQADEGYAIKNATGSELWVRCDGQTRASCSDWTFIEDGAQATLHSPDGKLVLHNGQFAAAVTFEHMRVTAPAKTAAIYANLANPFAPGSSSSNSSNTGTTYQAPDGLIPAEGALLTQNMASFTWNDRSATDVYRMILEIEKNGAWETYHDVETMDASLQVTLLSSSARYRWRVNSCNTEYCVSSPYAHFSTSLATQPQTPNTTAPGLVSGMLPAHESRINTDRTTLKWAPQTSAQTYNLTLRVTDPASNQWVEAGNHNGLTGAELEVVLQTRNTWYAWSVQACNTAGCGVWAEYSLFFRE